MRTAQITTVAVSVCCPECGEPQPDPNGGSDLWEPRQLRIASGQRRECVACDAVFSVHAEPRASVIYADGVANGRLPKGPSRG